MNRPERIENDTAALMRGIGDFSAFDSFRCRFKRPRDHKRDRKADRDQYDHQTHNPVRDFQKRKYLRSDLCDQPSDDGISDGYFVNVAPF